MIAETETVSQQALQTALQQGLSFLLDRRNHLSLWSDFFTPAGGSDEWVSGYTGSILANMQDPRAKDAALQAWQILEGSRHRDAGWGYSQPVPIDADSTCWVIKLAESLGKQNEPVVLKAKNYLRQAFTAGGVITYPETEPIRNFLGLSEKVDFSAWQMPHMCVTAAVGCIPEFTEEAAQLLAKTQNEDGSWPAYWWFENSYTTELAAEVLYQAGNYETCLEKAAAWARKQLLLTDRRNSFVLAHLLKIFKHAQDADGSTECLDLLLLSQQQNGSWRGTAQLRIPLPSDHQPTDSDEDWERWFGFAAAGTEAEKLANTFHILSIDQNSIFTTATVLDALNLFAEKTYPEFSIPEKTESPAFVTAGQLKHFQEEGFVILPEVFTKAEIANVEPHISEIVYAGTADAEDDKTPADIKAFLRTTGFWKKNPVAKAFVFDKRLAEIAAKLLQTDRVRLYYDQAFYKEAGQGATPWHQDRFYWPIQTDKILTFWVPLTDVDSEMGGGLKFINQSQKRGCMGNLDALSRSEENLQHFLAENQFEMTHLPGLETGNITAHFGWTIHGASPNQSLKTRKALTIIYYTDGAALSAEPAGPGAEVYDQQAAYIRQTDMQRGFPGLETGDAAVSRFTPLLHS